MAQSNFGLGFGGAERQQDPATVRDSNVSLASIKRRGGSSWSQMSSSGWFVTAKPDEDIGLHLPKKHVPLRRKTC
jgi:hypothetical protein